MIRPLPGSVVVLFTEKCVCCGMSVNVWVTTQCTRPLITSSFQSQGRFMATAGRLWKPHSEVVRCPNTSTAIYTSPFCHSPPILTSEPAIVGLKLLGIKQQMALIKASKTELKLNNLRAIFISMLHFQGFSWERVGNPGIIHGSWAELHWQWKRNWHGGMIKDFQALWHYMLLIETYGK